MIDYSPLWETMKKKGFSTYTLREKYKISSAQIGRLMKNQHVSTHTLNMFCNILECELHEVARYIPDDYKIEKVKE